eukprot:753536-Hanusia_phi.AAC.9
MQRSKARAVLTCIGRGVYLWSNRDWMFGMMMFAVVCLFYWNVRNFSFSFSNRAHKFTVLNSVFAASSGPICDFDPRSKVSVLIPMGRGEIMYVGKPMFKHTCRWRLPGFHFAHEQSSHTLLVANSIARRCVLECFQAVLTRTPFMPE